jgi:hypothetical protein
MFIISCVQNVNELCIAESISFNYFINELKMGLSKARNIALKYLLDNILSAIHYVS